MKAPSLILLLLLSTGLFSQQNPELQNFSIQHNNGIVYLDWVMKTGSVCNGIVVLRSEDSVHFISIGAIQGFCGSLSSPVAYAFQDAEPIKNKKLYYKLELGRGIFSGVVEIYIPEAGYGHYNLFPNPVSGNSILQYFNPRNENYVFVIMDMKGTEIKRLITSDETIEINREVLKPGLYYFILYKETGSDTSLGGNFIVSE